MKSISSNRGAMIDPYYKGPEYTLGACSNVVAALLGDHHTEVSLYIYRLYHAVEVYTGMYKTAETGLETRARSARVSKVSKVLCIPVYTDTAWYKVFMPCRYTARARTRAMAPAA